MDHQQVSHDANEFASSTRGYGHARCSRGVCPHRGRRWGADCVGDTRGRCIGHAPRDHSADLGFDLGSMVGCSAIVVDPKLTSAGSAFEARGRWRIHSCPRMLRLAAARVARVWRSALLLFLGLASCVPTRGVCTSSAPGEPDVVRTSSALLLEVDGCVAATGPRGRRDVLGCFGVNQISDLVTIDRVTHWLRAIEARPKVVSAGSMGADTVWIVPSNGTKWKHVCWVADLVRERDLLPQLGGVPVENQRCVSDAIGDVELSPIAVGVLSIPNVALGRSIELRLQSGNALELDRGDFVLTLAEIDGDFGDDVTDYPSFRRRRVELSEDAVATAVSRAVCGRTGVDVHVIVDHAIAGVSPWSVVRSILVGAARATGRVPLIANTPYALPRGYFVDGEWRKWVPGSGQAAPRGDQEPNVRR